MPLSSIARRAAEGQSLVALLGGRSDGDIVIAVLWNLRVALEEPDHRLDDEIIGAGVPEHPLLAGPTERGSHAIDEHDFSSLGHSASIF